MFNKRKYKIFIAATEQSGDNIGYNVILELLKINSNIDFDGIGGLKMAKFLSNEYYNLNDFNSMGIFEILLSIPRYLKMINYLSKIIIKNKYDLIITIDSPDFNYPLIKKVRKKNFNKPAIHIVAPTVWAWRKNRSKKFAQVFDELMVLFKFETKFFNENGLNTTFIGHPIYHIKNSVNNISSLDYIAFLPGSRISEINSLFPFYNIAYEHLLAHFPNVNIFIPTLPHLKRIIEKKVLNWKINTIIKTDKEEIEIFFLKCNKALVCSGTASLEIAKRNIPQLVIYKFNFFTEIIVKLFVKVKFANIINIFENKMIIPEITNSNLTKNSFLKKFKILLDDHKTNREQINNINLVLNKFQTNEDPYFVAAKKINSYL